MLTDRLIEEMGLMKLQLKASSPLPNKLLTNNAEPNTTQAVGPEPTGDSNTRETVAQIKPATAQSQPTQAASKESMEAVKLDKNEFRLLVKMLQAIKHECIYDHIQYDGHTVTYNHPKKTLVFNDITLPDTEQHMHLSSLKDLLVQADLKRPVWEKLKQL